MALLWTVLLLVGCGGPAGEAGREPVPPQAAALLGRAQQAYEQGAYVAALGLADSAAHHAPERPEIAFLKGLILRELLRYDEADAAFREALERDAAYRSARYNLGQNAFLRQRYREALRWYRAEERLLRDVLQRGEAGPKDRAALAVVLAQAGRSYALLGVADSARTAYRAALDLDTTHVAARAWLAELEREAGNLDAALAQARRVWRQAPGNPEYALLLAGTLLRAGRAEEALPLLQTAAQQQPWNREAVYQLGRALLTLGRTEEATRHLARVDTLEALRRRVSLAHLAVTQYPDDPARWEEYAMLLHQAGHRAEAVRAVRVARALRAQRGEKR
ncbi:MAG: hypothetical protein KatS3mg043_1986 [Rhodothermaceae bacterium]|nr:MAG: hypothetical protein KatS3mg043_1986 [Rhodothermaceae bacterium]